MANIGNAPKFNKSKIMSSAWSLFKNGHKIGRHVCTFGECLKEAWALARKEYVKSYKLYALIKKNAEACEKRDAERKPMNTSMDYLAGTLTGYYANSTYNGD